MNKRLNKTRLIELLKSAEAEAANFAEFFSDDKSYEAQYKFAEGRRLAFAACLRAVKGDNDLINIWAGKK